MPGPAPFPVVTATSPAAATNNALFPALYLYPLNDTWAPKHISLTNQHTKIGRQTSSKTAPGERNGFFDSKVLSRQHAEVWEENGKIYIKDVKSSNGTFINGERLSSEGHESEPFELKSDDIVEFGIDIVGEDNKTIIHHKVAARVVCVFSEQDAQVAARAEQHQQQQQIQQHQFLQQQHPNQQHPHPNQQQQQHPTGAPNGLGALGVGGGVGVSGLPGSLVGVGGTVGGGGPQNFPFAAQRRQLAQQGLGSMGGMRPPGKTGLSFDVILSRLQGEVQKSRETGAELNSLTGTMGEIHDTLGGAVPSNLPPFPTHLPPVRPPQEAQAAQPVLAIGAASPPTSAPVPSINGVIINGTSASADHAHDSSSDGAIDAASSSTVSISVVDLQSQLRETQSSLAAHLEKVRALEEVLQPQEMESVKREVREMRELMLEEQRRRNLGTGLAVKGVEPHPQPHLEREAGDEEDDEEEAEDDDDDARSIATVMPHELERVDEEDEEQMMLMAEEEAEERMVRRHQLQHQHQHQLEDDGHDSAEKEKEFVEKEAGASDPEAEALAAAEKEEEERRREDLDVGRPRTPEPTRMGLVDGYTTRSSLLGAGTVRSLKETSSSPLARDVTSSSASSSEAGPSTPPPSNADADVYAQVQRLSLQVSSVLQLTSSLEAQHSTAQTTIKGLEGKVAALEAMLRAAEEALGAQVEVKAETEPEAVKDELNEVEEEAKDVAEGETEPTTRSELEEEAEEEAKPTSSPPPSSLTALISQWKKSVEGQWGSVQSEWSQERERLARAREEWEAKSRLVEVGLEKVTAMQSVLAGQQEQLAGAIGAVAGGGSGVRGGGVYVFGNGDALKHNGGLVTPPSPRSQSSDSGGNGNTGGRYRRRRRRSTGATGSRGRSRDSSGSRDAALPLDEDVDVDTDTTLASSTEDDDGNGKHGIARALGVAAAVAASVPASKAMQGHISADAARSLATPEPSVYQLFSSVNSLDTDGSSSQGSSSQGSSPLKGKSPLVPGVGLSHPPKQRSDTDTTHDTASLLSFFAFTRGVLLMLFWSSLSSLLLLCSGVASLVFAFLRLLAFAAALVVRPIPRPPRANGNWNWDWRKQHPSPTTATSPLTEEVGPTINMQTAVGVVLLSVAAAAVFWKIKPE